MDQMSNETIALTLSTVVIIPWCVWVTVSLFRQAQEIALLKQEIKLLEEVKELLNDIKVKL